MIRPKKQYGQNFLEDEMILESIAHALPLTWKHVLEIGPGYGALTDFLLRETPASLECIEIDRDMVRMLRDRMHAEWTWLPLTLYEWDVLTFTPTKEEYTVIANIPYYITSPILMRLLYDVPVSPQSMIIMMQKEVWEKILSAFHTPRKSSYFSLLMEYRCRAIREVLSVPRTAFYPVPQVDSLVLEFVVEKERSREEEQWLIPLWRQAFLHPRKTLLSNLALRSDEKERSISWLEARGYTPHVRAERLTLEDWRSFLKELRGMEIPIS